VPEHGVNPRAISHHAETLLSENLGLGGVASRHPLSQFSSTSHLPLSTTSLVANQPKRGHGHPLEQNYDVRLCSKFHSRMLITGNGKHVIGQYCLCTLYSQRNPTAELQQKQIGKPSTSWEIQITMNLKLSQNMGSN